ncbi:MAG TPA: type II toxin-antitoxin system antitoxin SocA domain-containing protein [Noviherbaspirillum sp.]|nr:type II toxin-antitoxin system antitoxin SocA domain-containing protein [Noviherbaspirillum sp.]
MAYPALEIAKWFVNAIDRESGESMSPLKVQKLLYYAEAWAQLALERDLFNENIQACAHGPAVPEVFHEFKKFGWEAIPTLRPALKIDSETTEILKQVLDVYDEFSAETLEHMTHSDKPWLDARGDLPVEARREKVIPKAAMKEYFLNKYGGLVDEKADT